MSVNMQADKTEQNKFSRLLFDIKTSQDAPKIDVPDLIALLQCFGFVLHNFEKISESINTIDNGDNSINMEITCASSGMKATLTKIVPGCKCPSNDATSKAEFWNISGCGPSSQGNISKSMSSLVPSVTSGQAKLISFLLIKAFNAINNADVNQNNSYIAEILRAGNLSGLSRHRSLDTIKITNDNKTTCLPLWDAMPLIPSPKQTSSPIPNLCSSLKQISLGSQSATKLTDILKEMERLIAESLEITAKCQNATFVKPGDLETRRLSDIKISPLALEGENKPLTSSDVSKVKMLNNSGRKRTPQKRLIRKVCSSTGEMKCIVPPSKLVSLKGKRNLTGTPTTSKNVFLKADTPRPDVSGKPNASGLLKPKPLNLSDVKPKVSTRIDSKLASKLRLPQKVVVSSTVTKD